MEIKFGIDWENEERIKIVTRMRLDRLKLIQLNNSSCEVSGLLELEKYYKETYEDGRQIKEKP